MQTTQKDTCILINMNLKMPSGQAQTTTLIDFEADHSYFLYKFLHSKGFHSINKQLPPSTFINGTKTHCFTHYTFVITIFDHDEVS